MKIFLDFLCSSCGTVTEKLINHDVTCIECPECYENAVRQISMPTVKLEGITGSFPGAADKWARVREENARIKAKRT